METPTLILPLLPLSYQQYYWCRLFGVVLCSIFCDDFSQKLLATNSAKIWQHTSSILTGILERFVRRDLMLMSLRYALKQETMFTQQRSHANYFTLYPTLLSTKINVKGEPLGSTSREMCTLLSNTLKYVAILTSLRRS